MKTRFVANFGLKVGMTKNLLTSKLLEFIGFGQTKGGIVVTSDTKRVEFAGKTKFRIIVF